MSDRTSNEKPSVQQLEYPASAPGPGAGDVKRGENDSVSGNDTVVDVAGPEKELGEGVTEDDFPDGGLRAWLVVTGVSSLLLCLCIMAYEICRASSSLCRLSDSSIHGA